MIFHRTKCKIFIKILNLPKAGMASGVGGNVSPTMSKNTTNASSIVISRLTFSPDSAGRKKPRNDTVYMSRQGKIRLMM